MSSAIPNRPHQAVVALDFLVVGGSCAGLSAAYALRRVGHRVLVLEQNPDFLDEDRCGGYRIPPNMSKVFNHWGLGERILDLSLKSTGSTFVRFETDEHLGEQPWIEEVLRECGGEFLFAKYSEIRKFLYELGHEVGAKYRTNAKVVSIDVSERSVTLESGEVLNADVIIGADGRHGICRQLLLECQPTPKSAYVGLCTYNALVPGDKVRSDPELSQFLGTRTQFVLFGNGCGGFFFEVGDDNDMAIHFFCPDEQERGTDWNCTTEEMLQGAIDANAGPIVRKMISMGTNVTRAPMYDEDDLGDWLHDDGPMMLIGEAAHPMLYGSIQSTCMAIEDSAVLAKLFGHLSSRDQTTSFLYAFEELRQGRTKSTRMNELSNIRYISMPDDQGGIERDAHFRAQKDTGINPVGDEEESAGAASLWEVIKELWSYDAEDEADDWWVGWGMLRLRSQQMELEFGMEVQNTPLSLEVTVTL